MPTGRAGELRDGGILYGDIGTALEPARREALHRRPAAGACARRASGRALVTGQPAIQHDLDPIFASDLRRGEPIAVPLALLVLVLVLRALARGRVPFVFAACTIAATLAVVYVVAHEISMVTYVTNLVELIGLGARDRLLAAHRLPLPRGAGREAATADDAIVRTMATAGRAVVFSGLGGRDRPRRCCSSCRCRSSARWASAAC